MTIPISSPGQQNGPKGRLVSVRTLVIFALSELAGIGAALAAGLRIWAAYTAPISTSAIVAVIASVVIAKVLVTITCASALDRIVD